MTENVSNKTMTSHTFQLEHDQSRQLMSRFPTFELSYETVSHKKVSNKYDVCFAIPQGRKYYAWYTFLGDRDVCLLLEISREKKIGKVITVSTTFHPSLALGTLFYGTLVADPEYTDQQKSVFVIEDILWSKGLPLSKSVFGEKLGFLYELFSRGEIIQQYTSSTTDNQVVFCLPAAWSTEFLQEPDGSASDHSVFEPVAIAPNKWTNKIPYTIHHFQYRSLTTILPFINVILNRISTKAVSLPAIVSICNKSNDSQLTRGYVSPVRTIRADFGKPQY